MSEVQQQKEFMCPGTKKILEGKENDQPVHERLFLKASEQKDDRNDEEKELFKPKINWKYNSEKLGNRDIPID